jgi:Zn-dependent M28 family amino/carboxypeptidase
LSEEKHAAKDLKASLEMHIDVEPEEAWASNVVAMMKGNDPTLQDEWIVLTAHYDHLGFQETTGGEDGIWNGADDNASGTAAVLEIARRLASRGPLRRSVLVLLTSGEEQGLMGSAYYSKHPLVPREKVVLNINVDMVGRSTGAVNCVAAGCDEVFSAAHAIGKRTGVEVKPDQHPTWRMVYFVDSYHFARLNIPFIQFMTEFHSDYHQPSDEVNSIRFKELGNIVEVIFELTKRYVQGERKPTFRRPKWFLTTD